MNFFTSSFIFSLSYILFYKSANSQELPENFMAVRPSAVGGAFTAIANDENSVWANPAGISRITKARSRKKIGMIKVPNLVMAGNSKSKEFLTNLNRGGDLQKIAQQADNLGEKPFWAYTGAFPLIMFDITDMPAIFGVYTTNKLSSSIDSINDSLAKTEVISDTGVLWGIAYTDPSNRMSIGLSTRYLTRYAFEDSVPLDVLNNASQLQKTVKNGASRSNAFAYDLGFLWTLADFWFPTFGVAVLNSPNGCKSDYLNPFSKVRENVCGTVYSGGSTNTEMLSKVDPTDIRVGISITPRFGRSFAARIALDAHHLSTMVGGKSYGLQEVSTSKKLHTGIEFFTGNPLLPPPFSIGFGVSQGFYTFGLSTKISKFSLEFASVGKDVSAESSPEEDRRYIGALSLSW